LKNNYKFYDTSSLLKNPKGLFDDCEHWAISSITLEELEDIKSSNHKTEEIKAKARKIVR
jgi:predicted ribonuclease YlaK